MLQPGDNALGYVSMAFYFITPPLIKFNARASGSCNLGRYDITCSNWNDEYANSLDRSALPDIVRIVYGAPDGQVLVKKSYKDKRKKHGKRNWKLQQLPKEEENVSRREEEAAQ